LELRGRRPRLSSSLDLRSEAAVTALERQLLVWHKTNPRESAAGQHSGHWADHRHGLCHDGCGPEGVPLGPRVRRLAGLDAPADTQRVGKPGWGITKRGNRYLRRLLINGASANLLRSKATKADPWVIGLRQRRPPLVVAVALANKTARIAWAVMLREKEYQPTAVAA
jgi:transposase